MPCKYNLQLERGAGIDGLPKEVCSSLNLKYLKQAHPKDFGHIPDDYFVCDKNCKNFESWAARHWKERAGFD